MDVSSLDPSGCVLLNQAVVTPTSPCVAGVRPRFGSSSGSDCSDAVRVRIRVWRLGTCFRFGQSDREMDVCLSL